MRENCSFYGKALVIISLMLIGTPVMLVALAAADYYSQVMPVEIYLDDTEEIQWERTIEESVRIGNSEIPVEKITAEVKKGNGVGLKFETVISCKNSLKVILINEDEQVFLASLYDISSKSIEGGGCQVKGKTSFSRGSFAMIFLSPGEDGKYGRYDKEWTEFWTYCQSLENKDQEQIIELIIDQSAATTWSQDSVNVKRITVREKRLPESAKFIEIEVMKTTKEEKMKVSGRTNLRGELEWIFKAIDENLRINGETKIEDGEFSFLVNTVNFKGDYALTFEIEDYAKEFSGKWPPIVQPTPTPYFVPEVSTPTPVVIKQVPTPTPIIVIKKRPAPTPKTNHSIFSAIAAIAIVVFLKRKK